MDWIALIIALCAGISLSAACGFRIFLPLLALSVAVRFFGFGVNEHLTWVGGDTAFYTLLVATVVEVLAYYIPAVDNVLDAVVGPLSMVAGAVVTAGLLPEMPDALQWVIGIVVGSGAAGSVRAGTAALRGTSTVTTAGLGNPILSTLENILSAIGSVLAIVLPVLAILGVLVMVWVIWAIIRRLRRGSSTPAST